MYLPIADGAGAVLAVGCLANLTAETLSTSPRAGLIPAAEATADFRLASCAAGTLLSTISATLSRLTLPGATCVRVTVLSTAQSVFLVVSLELEAAPPAVPAA